MTQLLERLRPKRNFSKRHPQPPRREESPTGRAGTFNATSARTGPDAQEWHRGLEEDPERWDGLS